MPRLDVISLSTARRLLLVILAIAWMAGILIDDLRHLPLQPCLLFSGLTLLLLIIFWHNQLARWLLLVLLCMGLGASRCAKELPQYDPQSLLRFMDPNSPISIRGTVSDEPKLQTHTRTLTISVNAVQNTGSTQWKNANGTIEVVVLYQGVSVEDRYGANYGDKVELYGKLQSPAPISQKNITASMPFPRIHVSATGGNPIIAFINHLRNQLATFIEQVLPQPEAALLIGIFLGLSTPALNSLSAYFKVTGTTHLLVASGSNITIIAGLVYHSTQRLLPKNTGSFPLTPLHKSWRDWIRTTLLLLSIAFYTILSGAGPASIRAGIMGALLVIAPMLGRYYNVYTALAGAAIIMSCIDPLLLWDVGFQLSFSATLGIVLLTPYLQRLMQPITKLPAGSLIVEMAAVTLAAQVATLPILAVAFQRISLIAPIANILIAPLPGPLILLGLVISITGFVLHPLSLLCGWIAWPLLWYMKTTVILCAQIPFASTSIENIPAPIAWLFYALLTLAIGYLYYRDSHSSTKQAPPAPTRPNHRRVQIGTVVLLLTRRNRRLLQVYTVILILVITGIAFMLPPSIADNTISFFDIHTTKANKQDIHGESIFIRTQDGKTLLINGGNDSTSLSQALDSRLPSWQRSLDMVILTSPEQYTLTGLQDVLTRYDVGSVFHDVESVFDAGMAHPTTSYARWRQIIKERNLNYKSVSQDTTIQLGATTQLQVLWPQKALHTSSDEIHDNGLILRLVMPGIRILLLGSSVQSKYALSSLLSTTDNSMLKADIVQVLGETNTPAPVVLTDVLQQADPSLVVITSPMQPKSRQSTNDTRLTLSSALESVPQVLHTDQKGTIELHSDSSGWTMDR
jgi:competence protein ComEC